MTITQLRSQAQYAKPLLGALGVGALLVTVGCGAGTGQGVLAQPGMTASASANQPGAPIVVSCEPNQRTLVRSVVINGATVSQVECITNGAAPISTQPFEAPAAESYRQVRTVQPVTYVRADDLPDARVVPVSQPATVARPIPARQVVYADDRPVRRARSVKKSAIIIGSSAGAGAGVGAAIGGKKGALIGAAIGGGGAALWDQITRRDR